MEVEVRGGVVVDHWDALYCHYADCRAPTISRTAIALMSCGHIQSVRVGVRGVLPADEVESQIVALIEALESCQLTRCRRCTERISDAHDPRS